MTNYVGTSPFNGLLPPLQPPPRVAPTLPPQGFVAASVEETPQQPALAPTGANVAEEKPKAVDTEAVEDTQFTYEGYQVVRGEYFSHINEPSITFCDNRFSVNAACLKKAPTTEFVQVLVNQDEKKLAVRPCSEDVKDSFAWCTVRRKTKKVVCPLFFGKIMTLMGWDPKHRYKVIGKLIRSQGQYLFVFDLNSPEIYTRTIQIDENGNEKRKTARKPAYLDSWKDQFGMPVEEHQQALQINIFDGYALIGVKEQKHQASPANENTEEVAHVESENHAVDTGGLDQAQNPSIEVYPSESRFT